MWTGWIINNWEILLNSEWIFDTLSSSLLENSVRLWVAVVVFFFWICALIRTIKDANARSYSFWFVLLSAFIVILLTPVLWIPLYVAIRPQGWKWDKIWWRNVAFLQMHMCENCWSDNLVTNKCCVNCGEPLQTTCRECQNEYSVSYNYCPECGAPRLEM